MPIPQPKPIDEVADSVLIAWGAELIDAEFDDDDETPDDLLAEHGWLPSGDEQ